MTAPLDKVASGDPLAISARAFNAMLDATIAHRGHLYDRGPAHPHTPPRSDLVLVRNDTGGPLDEFAVLGISGPIITPNDDEAEFTLGRLLLSGVTPAAGHVDRFVVTAEPIDIDKIGTARVHGLCVVRVEIVSEQHRTAEAKTGETGHLVSSAAGTATLLWVQDPDDRAVEGIAWCVVRFGGGGGGGTWQWAQVQSVDTDRFDAKLLDDDWLPVGDAFEVRCYGATDSALTVEPLLANCTPYMEAAAIVRVVQLPNGTWWLWDFLHDTSCSWSPY